MLNDLPSLAVTLSCSCPFIVEITEMVNTEIIGYLSISSEWRNSYSYVKTKLLCYSGFLVDIFFPSNSIHYTYFLILEYNNDENFGKFHSMYKRQILTWLRWIWKSFFFTNITSTFWTWSIDFPMHYHENVCVVLKIRSLHSKCP